MSCLQTTTVFLCLLKCIYFSAFKIPSPYLPQTQQTGACDRQAVVCSRSRRTLFLWGKGGAFKSSVLSAGSQRGLEGSWGRRDKVPAM